MTARTCPVHGEYSETGVCRWCEPETKHVEVGRVAVIDEWNRIPESAVAKAIREYHATSGVERPLGSTLRRYSTPEGVASHAAFWEAKLATEHAALRWERVARRWGSKHPTMLDLANGWGRFVVEAMREHAEKLARTNPLLQDKP